MASANPRAPRGATAPPTLPTPRFPPVPCRCSRCRVSFESKGALLRHLPTCVSLLHTPTPFDCRFCGDHFPSRSAGFRHVRAGCQAATPPSPPKPTTCRRCGVSFGSRSACFLHLVGCRMIPMRPKRLPPPPRAASALPTPPRSVTVNGVTWPSRRAHKRWLKANPPPPPPAPRPEGRRAPPPPKPKRCRRCDVSFGSLAAYGRHVKAGCRPPPTPKRERRAPPSPVASLCDACGAGLRSRRSLKQHKRASCPGFPRPAADAAPVQEEVSTTPNRPTVRHMPVSQSGPSALAGGDLAWRRRATPSVPTPPPPRPTVRDAPVSRPGPSALAGGDPARKRQATPSGPSPTPQKSGFKLCTRCRCKLTYSSPQCHACLLKQQPSSSGTGPSATTPIVDPLRSSICEVCRRSNGEHTKKCKNRK